MKKFNLKYGNGAIDVSIAEEDLLGVIDSSVEVDNKSEEEVIRKALENPIGSNKLKELVHPGEKICIVVSDITRAWQKMSVFLPYIIEELNGAGIKDEDIIFISATGSHRGQTEEEHKSILGEELYKRFTIIDHECTDKENLTYIGTTSFGTPISINKIAAECDHIVLTGAIVFHLLVGWGGGKKSLLPGISSYETIMANHALTLSPILGEGTNPLVRCGNTKGNPVHEDMVEACRMINPTFMFNVIIDGDGKIINAVAGDCIEAHEEGCKIVDKYDGVYIDEKADLVIASAGGYPKDINLYQSSKTIINAREAVKKGGTIIILSQCSEGFGNYEVEDIIHNYNTILEREETVRKNFTIPRYIGYFTSEVAYNFNMILVGEIDENLVKNAGIRVFKTLDDALEFTYKEKGKTLKTYLMPHGANTLPKLRK
ncbi:nickel-dependent lactate racemase [Clostridium bovifaecis]|uniref:Nickel-dependent lactate racemase n=1 Tax=Clostridium bovifaecis TaxID=2184719 RepID=A0A6I6ET65_9CLOT|nr:nickel-dependent lactate racemase [Clostridium bovifaecis]